VVDVLPIMGMSKIITYNGEKYALLHYEGDCWVYLSLDKKKILKRPKRDFAYRELVKEASLLPKLKDFGLPVPSLLEWDERSATLVEEFILGRSLDRFHKRKVEFLIPQLRKVLCLMGTLKWETLKDCRLERYVLVSWKDQLVEWVKLGLSPFLSFSKIKKVICLIDDIFIEEFTPVFLHGDLVFRHIIVDGKNRFWMIDWSDSFFSDPVYDLAFLYYSSGKNKSWLHIYQLSTNELQRVEFYSTWLPAIFTLEEGKRERNKEELKEGFILLRKAMVSYGFV